MKYIRTKDGVFETIDYDQLPNALQKQLDEREYSCMKDYKNIGVFVKMKQGALIISNIQPLLLFAIQKQADTIEELCDGFIFKDTNANELHFFDKNSGISILGASLFSDTFRGYIETDKGLIYVAKMTDKGMELL